jgi:phage shock protein PspC (stress-responsive transcriptional regulator)
MDPVTVVLFLVCGFIVFLAGYVACITFLPKSHRIKEIEFSLKPPKIRFIFK